MLFEINLRHNENLPNRYIRLGRMIFDPLWVVCYHFYDKVMKDGVHIVPPVITEMIFIQVFPATFLWYNGGEFPLTTL